jgi:hypothetical protein
MARHLPIHRLLLLLLPQPAGAGEVHEIVLQAKTATACHMAFGNYFWIPRSGLETLGIDASAGVCGGGKKPCGSLAIGVGANRVNRSLSQINPHDGHDACQLCGCDLAYIQFSKGQPRLPADFHPGAKVKMSWSAAPGPPPSPQPPPPPPGPHPPPHPPPGPAPPPWHPDRKLSPKAYTPLPLGAVAPKGWLLEQLLLQANSLAGKMAVSQFPGAKDINQSAWVGGPGTGGNTIQWLPYWTNGQVPLIGLLEAAGKEATDRLDPRLGLRDKVDTYMEFVLTHANKSSGLIGPWQGEGGHWGWDPLNMIRSLYNWMQYRPSKAEAVAKVTLTHLTAVYSEMASGDKTVQEWAKMRWPSFVDVLQWTIDEIVPVYGGNPNVCPLGAAKTIEMLHNASDIWRLEGFAWATYYGETPRGVDGRQATEPLNFPKGPVDGWNVFDHGVNNAEGAMRWPAVMARMNHVNGSVQGSFEENRARMDRMLQTIDTYQGTVAAGMCADEVYCGRSPHRGTETCTVVEQMASLEFAFTTFGTGDYMDRVERLAYNGLPAALTADMETHVYVQQANSVFAGRTTLAAQEADPSLKHHELDNRHSAAHSGWRSFQESKKELAMSGCQACGGGGGGGGGGSKSHVQPEPGGQDRAFDFDHFADSPSGEDMSANYYGVDHFPCCITNFPQGTHTSHRRCHRSVTTRLASLLLNSCPAIVLGFALQVGPSSRSTSFSRRPPAQTRLDLIQTPSSSPSLPRPLRSCQAEVRSRRMVPTLSVILQRFA